MTHICESLEPKGGHITERWGEAPGSEGAGKSGVSVEVCPEMDDEREEGHAQGVIHPWPGTVPSMEGKALSLKSNRPGFKSQLHH